MLEPGSQVGRYEIQRRLGRGGMGSVYVAHDPVLGRMVAVKVFAGDLDIPDARERFSREARAAAALNHPNIVTIYDFGEYSSQPFIVMEYVPGETLLAMIRRKAPVSTVDKLRWIDELCAGVGYAHRMSVIHRDLKPANLMIDRSGRLKILDFGVARMMGTASSTVAMVGTPGYMSPEQIHGDAVDHRSDLFAVGVVLYELLSYTEAFPGDTVPTIVHRVLSDTPVPLAGLVPEVGPELVGIVDRLLEKKPADRFDGAESVRAALMRVRTKVTAEPSWNEEPTRIVRRDTPPASWGGGRGTGSARKGIKNDAVVAQLTPPPGPRSGDREAIARRRVEQLNAALARAHARFAAGELENALDECEQALTFDEDHVEALALEQEIREALNARFDAGPTVAVSPLDVTDVPAARVPLSATASEPAVPVSDVLPVTAGDAVSADAPRGDTVLAPARSSPLPAQTTGWKERFSRAIGMVRAAANDLSRQVLKRVREIEAKAAAYPRHVRWGAAAAMVLIAGTTAMMMRPAEVPMGTLVIEATPWASVAAIETESGEAQPLPSAATTPLSLVLPQGSYSITLTGPPPENQSRRVTVRVATGSPTVMPPVRFGDITPDEYFEQYLSAPAPTHDSPVAGGAGTDVPSAAPASASGGPSPSPSGVSQ